MENISPNAVVKASAYCLVHAPDLLLTAGTTLTRARQKQNFGFITEVAEKIPDFASTVAYAPNQCYIGGITPEQLKAHPQKWHENLCSEASRFGQFGEIMPLIEFIGLIKKGDSFDLVALEESFLEKIKSELQQHPVFKKDGIELLPSSGATLAEIKAEIEENEAEELTFAGNLVGCVKRAHEYDPNLTAPIILENLVAKASAYLALKNLLYKNDILPQDIDYIIETSEEACGDMNQRGGGNFAKAIGEMADCVNATGSDLRAFCAAPVHGIINAAALVKSGIYKNVVVLAGGATSKLGMNAHDHLKKDIPILENVLGTFAVLVSADDGISPVIGLKGIGRHTIGSKASPQAVTEALIAKPLSQLGLTIKDVDKYSVEMQNPEITKPAGAGDVPLANYKMIAALGVKKGDLLKEEMMDFVNNHGMVGWAPTQGHIPSGVPYLGFAGRAIKDNQIERAMIIGKGSLFLARMTSLSDGVSFVLEKNRGDNSSLNGSREKEMRQLLAEGLRKLSDII